MLYVDNTNTAAIATYEKRGFVVQHTDRSFVGTV